MVATTTSQVNSAPLNSFNKNILVNFKLALLVVAEDVLEADIGSVAITGVVLNPDVAVADDVTDADIGCAAHTNVVLHAEGAGADMLVKFLRLFQLKFMFHNHEKINFKVCFVPSFVTFIIELFLMLSTDLPRGDQCCEQYL